MRQKSQVKKNKVWRIWDSKKVIYINCARRFWDVLVYLLVYIIWYIYSGFGKSRNRTIKLTDERISWFSDYILLIDTCIDGDAAFSPFIRASCNILYQVKRLQMLVSYFTQHWKNNCNQYVQIFLNFLSFKMYPSANV